jgi:hypothetical protein
MRTIHENAHKIGRFNPIALNWSCGRYPFKLVPGPVGVTPTLAAINLNRIRYPSIKKGTCGTDTHAAELKS